MTFFKLKTIYLFVCLSLSTLVTLGFSGRVKGQESSRPESANQISTDPVQNKQIQYDLFGYLKVDPAYTWHNGTSDLIYYKPVPVTFRKRTKDQCTPISKVNRAWFGRTRFQNMGICYSYSLADLLTYYVQKDHQEQSVSQISALDLGITFAQSLWQSQDLTEFKKLVDGGGVINQAFDLVAKRGWACSEKSLTSDSGSYNLITTGTTQDLYSQYKSGTLNLLDKIIKLKTEIDMNGDMTCRHPPVQEGVPAISNSAQNKCFKNLGSGPVSGQLFGDDRFLEIARRFKSSNQEFVKYFHDTLCDHSDSKIDLKKYKMISKFFSKKDWPQDQMGHSVFDGEFFFRDIDDHLAAGEPISFSVTSDFLTNNVQVGGGGHAMLLLSRDWEGDDDGSCIYEVRNSWGADCSYYEKSPNVRNCDPQTGNFWISETNLKNNLIDINYLF